MRKNAWHVVLVAAIAFMAQGCYSLIPQDEYDDLCRLGDINAQQSELLNRRTEEKNALEKEKLHLLGQVKEKDEHIAQLRGMLKTVGDAVEEQRRWMEDARKRLAESPSAQAAGVTVIQTAEGLGFSLVGDVLFDPGKAEVKPGGQKVLREAVVPELKKSGLKIRVSGFTDSDPIKVSGWDSNLQLSGARAYAVLKYLKSQGIPEERMHFAGYGEFDLKKKPDGMEDQEASRRAEIILLTPPAPPGAEGKPVP